jgi:hypothetical protein
MDSRPAEPAKRELFSPKKRPLAVTILFALRNILLLRMKPWFFILFALILASLACSFGFNPPPITQIPQQAAPSATPLLLTPTATSPVPPGLTAGQIRNATLTVTGSDQMIRTISLKNGKFEQGADPAQPGYVSITLGEKIAFGDLNGDGLEDAAVILAENYGGSGVFVSVVALINQGGQPEAVATALVDDRAMVNDLSIKDGLIFLDATIHGANDPACCPSLATTRNYRLIENALILSRYTTKTPAGVERAIAIEAPANGSEVSGTVTIKGSVTVAPFENNLAYSVFQQGGSDLLTEAGFLVKAGALGGPGTFDLTLDLSKITFKGPIRIQISDLSPADGSFLAMSTLYLVLK